jgi:hypothetical protein
MVIRAAWQADMGLEAYVSDETKRVEMLNYENENEYRTEKRGEKCRGLHEHGHVVKRK